MRFWLLLGLVVACKAKEAAPPPPAGEPEYKTTSGPIAIKNLQFQIDEAEKQASLRRPALVELLLTKAQFLAQPGAYARAVALTEALPDTSAESYLLRAKVRSALHRFRDADADLDRAAELGAEPEEVASRRSAIAVATGGAGEVVSALEAAAQAHAGYPTLTALASAYAAVGRFEEADRAYVRALELLRSTSPFPFAWVHFMRGLMWFDRAGDRARGGQLYQEALKYLPQYAAANVHLAAYEADQADFLQATARLEKVVETSDDPEPLAYLGDWYRRLGQTERGEATIAKAKARYEELLALYPLAFADHAAEFYLGPGADVARALVLAQQNAQNRETERALALLIRAARAAGQQAVACATVVRVGPKRTGAELAGLLEGCPLE